MSGEKKSRDVVARSFGSFHSSNIETQLKAAETDEYVPPDFPVYLPNFAEYRKCEPEFGKPMKKKHFLLDDSLVFLNHGAFGAALKDGLEVAQDVQRYVEAQPVRFIDRELFPQIVHTQKRLAKYIGCKPSDFAMTENATLGTNSVLNSLELDEESVIYHLSTVYGAVKKSMDKVCQRTGAKMQMETLRFPLESKEDILDLVKTTLKPNTALALFSHIPSNTPFIMPVKELVQICHERNVPVLIDGAHALGTVILDLTDIDADYYILNTHKWFCSPKGCAALYVKPEHQAKIGALSVSHGYKSGFHSEHTFPGLRDYSPILGLQCCINFFNAIGPEVIITRNHSLLVDAVQLLTTAWKSSTLAPLDMHSSMCCVALPSRFYKSHEVKYEDAELVQNRLFHEHKIEVPVKCVQGVLYVRISVHIHNELSDYQRLSDAVLAL
uniref:Hercynylcysteine sulfoxide lyase-like n=1 Tax=Phallusia mammillata TaxID=59560 RepID=A0A6F9DA29_9ASCI|nr:hercynylcysteine sulfoxide lyase-like [Phallusia mammillata]